MTQDDLFSLAMEIKAKTPDPVIEALLKGKEHTLLTFNAIRQTANVIDAARDRLRTYIQPWKPDRYGNTLLSFKSAGNRVYVNSLGNSCMVTDVHVHPTAHNPEHTVAPGEEVTVRNAKGEIMFRGVLVDNATLYSEKESHNIVVTEIPGPK